MLSIDIPSSPPNNSVVQEAKCVISQRPILLEAVFDSRIEVTAPKGNPESLFDAGRQTSLFWIKAGDMQCKILQQSFYYYKQSQLKDKSNRMEGKGERKNLGPW